MKIYITCPVRGVTDAEKEFLDDYVARLEAQGHEVHYPSRDTNQVDLSGGYQICCDNTDAVINSDKVRAYWNKTSTGSLFDLGIAFNEHRTKGKRIRLINRPDVESIVAEEGKPKSFEHVLLKLDNLANL